MFGKVSSVRETEKEIYHEFLILLFFLIATILVNGEGKKKSFLP